MPETLVDLVRPDGAHVVEKRAVGPEEATAISREAETLAAGRHPGVVELVGLEGDPGLPVLVTAYVDGPSLDHAGPLDPEEVAGAVAGIAATVADLHELGLVHGALEASHVIIGPHGHAVLCGFRQGGRAGEPAPHPTHASPATGGNDPVEHALESTLDQRDDIRALGDLILALLPAAGSRPRGGVVPEPDSAGAAAEALRRIADKAGSARPEERPTARAIASLVYDSVPGARLPRPVPTTPGRPPPVSSPSASRAVPGFDGPLDDWRRHLGAATPSHEGPRWSAPTIRRKGGVTAAVVSALVGAGGLAWALLPVRAAPRLAGPSSAEPAPVSAVAPSVTFAPEPAPPATTGVPAPTAAQSRACPPVTGTLEADVDGDGCGEALTFVGGVLSAGSLRWSVGAPGDQVAVGDWSCRGMRTLALLRPSTGDVFRLEEWPAETASITASAVAHVDNGVAVRAADLDHDGCHELVVDVRDGRPTVVPGRREPR